MSETVLKMRGVCRRFGAVRANDDVDLEVRSGSIHAVVGENGAGKSTLLRIAYGIERADAGSIEICGQAMKRVAHEPRWALAAGLGMVHQHFMLVPTLTVLENVVLGREPARRLRLDIDAARRQLTAIESRYGLTIEPDARVESLSVGERQRVEILRVLLQDAKVIILDEPTAVLTPVEVEALFATLRELAAAGTAIVVVTHKLDEVLDLADEVTVLRAGKRVLSCPVAQVTADSLIEAMIGRPPQRVARTAAARTTQERLVVEAVCVGEPGKKLRVDNVSLAIRGGEVVGIAGIDGNGQADLAEAIAGLVPTVGGRIVINDVTVTSASVAARFAAGLSHIPADRHHHGLLLDDAISVSAGLGRAAAWSRHGVLSRRRLDAECAALMDAYEVNPRSVGLEARFFSGGNQQKLIVGRELSRPGASVLLASQPTRGVDVAAIELIHHRILEARDQGWAVLLISSELSEHLALADRILVMNGGRIVGEVAGAEREREDVALRLGAWMTGLLPGADGPGHDGGSSLAAGKGDA